MHRQPPHIAPLILLLCSLLLGAGPALASGALSGVATLGLASYRSSLDGVEQSSGDSMTQQYSLRYATSGILGDARAGRYRLMLGYELNVLDASLADGGAAMETRITTSKPFYEGSFVLAPGGLPFRLSGYVRDLHRTSFIGGGDFSEAPLGTQPTGHSRLLEPNVITELQNGTHREIGSTLIVGIRNGSYLGNYRDVLSQVPRLLVDFKQIDVRDLARDNNRSHYRARDLAFVSLNKKDNWVHYRMHDYVDFLNGSNDFVSQQVLLGTVDQAMMRQWINLTNWIRLSGDLSFNTEKKANEADPEEFYRLNLQAVGRRTASRVALFSSFERKTKGELLSETGSVPLFADFEVDRDTRYHLSYSASVARSSYLDDGPTPDAGKAGYSQSNSDQNLFLGAEFNRTGAILFNPRLSVESRQQEGGSGLAEQLGLEWRNRADLLRWVAGYELTSNQTANDNGASGVYLQNRLYGSMEKAVSRTLRGGLSAVFLHGSGHQGAVSFALPTTPTGVSSTATQETSITQFNTHGFFEHRGPRFANRLEADVATSQNDVDSDSTASLQHVLQADTRERTFRLSSQLLYGAGASLGGLDYLRPASGSGGLFADAPDLGWSSAALYVYTPSRKLRLQLTGDVAGSLGGEVDNLAWRGTERLSYSIYTVNGIIRKFAELSEEFGYEAVSEGLNGRDAALFLRLSGSIYPTKYFYGRIAAEFVDIMPTDAAQYQLSGETGLNFEKMQVALSYATAAKEAEIASGLPEVVDRRWDLKVRKIF